MGARMRADLISGLIGIAIGVLSLIEAYKLFPYRMSAFVGDHTMPGLCGVIMVVLSIILLIQNNQSFETEWPQKSVLKIILVALVVLLLYVTVISYLGYLIATCLGSVILFRIFGSHSWKFCTLMGLSLTVVLYLIFILWLNMPFPTGIFNL